MSFRNVTLNASDSSTATQILYAPALCTGAGWSVNTTATNGSNTSYKSCTADESGDLSVNMKFTGVAVYYTSPYFDGLSMRFSLDGGSPKEVNISQPIVGNDTSTTARALWETLGLENKTHTLEITPVGGGKTLNIGTFVITEAISTPANITAAPPKAAAATQSSTTTNLGIAFGSAFGGISLLIFLWISWTLFQRRKEQSKRYDWPQDRQETPDQGQDVNFDRSAFSHNSHMSPTSAYPANGGIHSMARKSPSQESISSYGHNQVQNRQSDHGVASPVPSNTVLLPQRTISSSQSTSDAAGPISAYQMYSSKLEPVSDSRNGSPPPPPSPSYTSGNRYTNPLAYSPQTKHIPLLSRTPLPRSSTLPASSSAPPLISSVARNTTYSGKLEPVRKKT